MQIGVYSLDKGGFPSTCHSYCYDGYRFLVLFQHGTRGFSDIHSFCSSQNKGQKRLCRFQNRPYISIKQIDSRSIVR